MASKFSWKTISRVNGGSHIHSWKIRLIGKPEIKYLDELITVLHNGGFEYRFTNSTTGFTRKYTQDVLYYDRAYLSLIDGQTGEVIADRGDVIRICVYTRKEVK